jgi:hypothetical protein
MILLRIRIQLYNDVNDTANFLPPDEIVSLIVRFGCVPRTIFDFGNRAMQLEDIEKKLENVTDVERLLAVIGSSFIEHRGVSYRSFRTIVSVSTRKLPTIPKTIPPHMTLEVLKPFRKESEQQTKLIYSRSDSRRRRGSTFSKPSTGALSTHGHPITFAS